MEEELVIVKGLIDKAKCLNEFLNRSFNGFTDERYFQSQAVYSHFRAMINQIVYEILLESPYERVKTILDTICKTAPYFELCLPPKAIDLFLKDINDLYPGIYTDNNSYFEKIMNSSLNININ